MQSWLYCLNFALHSLKTSDSIFEFYNHENPIIYVKMSLYRTELKPVHFWLCCAFAPLKYLSAYLNSSTPKTLLYTQTLSPYLVQNYNLCNFGLFFNNFGCHGNSLGSIENSGSIFEFNNRAYLTVRAKNSSISCKDLIYVPFWLIFPKFGCHGNPINSLKIQIAHLKSQARKTIIHFWKIPGFLIRNRDLYNFNWFLPKVCCHGNSPDSREI